MPYFCYNVSVPKPYSRKERIEEELAHNATSFLHKEASENLGLISCTRVKMASDFSNALFFISFYPPLKEGVAVKDVLAPYLYDLKHYLVERVPMRKIPKISFSIDKSVEEVARIDKIIDSL